MDDTEGLVELARIVETHWNWTGTGFRVFCIELRCPTEYVHVAVLGDTKVQAVVIKDYIDRRLLDAWADSLAEMAANRTPRPTPEPINPDIPNPAWRD